MKYLSYILRLLYWRRISESDIFNSVALSRARNTITLNGRSSRKGVLSGANIQAEGDLLVGPGVFFVGGDHRIPARDENVSYFASGRGVLKELIVIEKNVWIGANSVIMAGVTLAEGTIGRGSTITKSTEPYAIYEAPPSGRQDHSMNQIIQNLSDGSTLLAEVPRLLCNSRSVLIRTSHTLVSLGTEKMLVDFEKGRSFGPAAARQSQGGHCEGEDKRTWTNHCRSQNKLEQPIPLDTAMWVRLSRWVGRQKLSVGDRVASNGPHAEYVSVPKNLVAKIPYVSDEQAAFTVIGSIGLQGIRLVNPTLGETVVVSGLG